MTATAKSNIPSSSSLSGVHRGHASLSDRVARSLFIWPAVVILLFFSIFPLIVSLWLSFSRIKFVRGGVEIIHVGWANYRKILLGSEQPRLLGVMGQPSLAGWILFALIVAALIYLMVHYVRNERVTPIGFGLRLALNIFLAALAWLAVSTISPNGRPGALIVTFLYVFVGIALQYLIGLGLALLTAQQLPGRHFFRVVFLLPMMITPVGVAFMFRMLTDTVVGPFSPVWKAIGLGGTSWVNNPWGARAAVIIGDVWQWTPFMFIILLAAIEAQQVEPIEAAIVDGANRWQIFRYITLPAILPVSSALVLIRMIEGFKIIDLPNVLTNGGPGTATESLTLSAFVFWRTLDIGGSAAIAYILLIIVTIISVAFVNLVRRRFSEVA
jgi:multiple sugar transport system permease protein